MLVAASNSSSPVSFIFLLALPVALYFLMLRPQKKRMQAQQQLSRSIGDGDEVMTTSGVYGFVTAIEDDVVWLEIAEGVDIRITRSAIAKRVTPAAETATEDAVPATPDSAT